MYNKKKTLEGLNKLFTKYKVLKMKDLKVSLPNISERTIFRYLVALDYIASYTHAGRYYTLKSIANFNESGFWHFGEISFSKYGTLKNTTLHLIDHSIAGKTHAELEMQQRIRVHNVLLELVRSGTIHREQFEGIYLYLSQDIESRQKQLKQHYEEPQALLSDTVVIEILVCVIQASSSLLTPEETFSILQKQGSSITLNQVRRVFQTYALEKKTLD